MQWVIKEKQSNQNNTLRLKKKTKDSQIVRAKVKPQVEARWTKVSIRD